MTLFFDNTLSIDIQPKQNFHFRYVSELSNTHGVLIGPPDGVIEDTYPTVRLQLPSDGYLDEFGNKRDFFVLCSLHSYNTDTRGPQSISPHLLMKKGNKTPTFDFICEAMEQNNENPLERSFQLKDYVIVRLKPDDYFLSLTGKRKHFGSLQLPLEFDRLKGDLNIDDIKSVKTSAILNVCLGFTIFERDFYTNEFRLYRETIYSNNIFHGDDLRIHELCNTKGPISGGTKVHILIKLQSTYKYFVRMFKYSSDMTHVDWEAFVPITNGNIFSNAAITYTLPAGPANVNTDEIEVMIEIVVDQSTYKSKAVKFWYVNTNDNESGRRKRPRPIESSNSTALVTEVLTLPNSSHAIDPNLMHYRSPLQAMPVTEPNLQAYIAANDIETNYLPHTEEFNTFDIFMQGPPIANVDDLITSVTEQSLNEPVNEEFLLERFIVENCHILNENPAEPMEPLVPYYSRDHCESVGSRNEEITNETPKKSIDIAELIKSRIDQIFNADPKSEISITGLSDRSGNTIFHDAVMDMDTLVHLYRLQKKSPRLKELILKARNTYRQNLLHYACVHDKASCLRPLVGMGIALHEQDSLGRTPLHIAIEHKNDDCRLKIQNLLQDHSQFPSELETQLIKMFQVYSHKGHTVLHAAAIENLYDLVEVMLEFCQSHNLDILQYEALGNGDSIAHLVVKRNLVGMMGLIRKYVPQYLTVENYPGHTVFEVPELSKEMLEALSIK